MLSRTKVIIILLCTLSVRAISALPALIDDAEAIKISGGETHTMVLSANKWVWVCGDNDYSQLGIGSAYQYADQRMLVRVHGFNDAGRLGDINDIAGGWKHSVALDVNDLLWSWRSNGQRCGDGRKKGEFQRFFVDFGRGNMV
jgi:alpha-tubulin suppressor-like RCC1 family protein